MYAVPSRPRAGTRRPAIGLPCSLLALSLLLLGTPALAQSRTEARPGRGNLDPLFYRDASLGVVAGLRQREIVKMLSAVASGSQMGPGEGWFHPGKGRYGWDWLAARFDANRDGRITPEEFKGPRELFDRLDRDRNGAITREDLDWSESSPYVRLAGVIGGW